MKKSFAIIMVLSLVTLMLCACASPEKRLENMIKQQTGQDIEIKDGGSSITVKGEDGESAKFSVGDDMKWPADKLGGLPELKGSLKGVIETDGGYFLTIESVSQADAASYVQKLKGLGYAGGAEANDEANHIMTFTGSKGESEVFFQYSAEGGNATLGYNPKRQE